MDPRDDIEFLTDDVPATPGAPAPTRRRRRWLVPLVGVALLGAGWAVIAHNSDPSRPAARAPSTSAPPAGRDVGPPLTGSPRPALDVALAGGRVLTVVPGRVVALAGGLRRRIAAAPTWALDVTSYRLLRDGTSRVWFVALGAPRTRMIEYDAATLTPLREVSWPRVALDAAALDGRLYLSTDLGVAELGPGSAEPHLVPGLYGAVGHVAADPARDRLLAIDLGTPTSVWSYRPGHGAVEAPATLPLVEGSLAVTGTGEVWAGGTGPGGRVLLRLDGRTLRPVDTAVAQHRSAPLIVAAGQRVLWARPRNRSDQLLCLTGSDGRVAQRWARVAGRVASRAGVAVAATSVGVVPLTLHGCPG